MILYLDKNNCNIQEDINGYVLIIETSEPVYIEDVNADMLLHSQWDNEFGGLEDKPYLTDAPKEYKI